MALLVLPIFLKARQLDLRLLNVLLVVVSGDGERLIIIIILVEPIEVHGRLLSLRRLLKSLCRRRNRGELLVSNSFAVDKQVRRVVHIPLRLMPIGIQHFEVRAALLTE